MIAAFIVGFVLLVALILVASYYSNKKRIAAFTAWASQHGWKYSQRDKRFDNLPWGYPFGQGHGRQASDVLTSTKPDCPALCFTYRYQTTSTSSNGNGGTTTQTDNHYYSIYSLQLTKPQPELRVSKEGVLGKLARMVGMHDIEFESEDFNRAFKVKSDDRKFASDVINPQMMQFLLAGPAPGFVITGSTLLLVQGGKLKLETVEPNVAYLQAVLTHVPNFVWG